MTDNDALADLAPFLAAGRADDASLAPPEHLTASLIASRPTLATAALSAPVAEDELPCDFGPYRLESILGRGATGTVYAAHDPELDRRIAVKVLANELAALPEARERFLREAQAAAGMQHDGLMPVFAVHQDTPSPCLTMPRLDGETLADRLRRDGPPDSETLIDLARGIATALDAAHAAGILHRDLKPSNIFMETKTGRPILMDFGLARALDAPSDLTISGAIAGTPEFLAPEQIDDDPDLTPATDLYGLGATLYTLATGSPVFEATSLTGLLKKVATDKPDPIGSVPNWFGDLVLTLLAKAPAARPASAAAVVEALDAQRPPRIRSAKPFPWQKIAAVVLFVVGAIAVWKIVAEKNATPGPFSLVGALASDAEVITIPTAGTHSLEPLTFGAGPRTIRAAQPGTVLLFNTTDQAAFTTAGPLTLENLTIRFSSEAGAIAPPLIKTSGDQLTITRCRIDQPVSNMNPFLVPSLIESTEKVNFVLEESAVLSFRTTLIKAAPFSSTTISDSLVFLPGVIGADEADGQHITIKDSEVICATMTRVNVEAESPTRFEVTGSRIEAFQIFSILGGNPDTIRACAQWSGQNNTLACSRRWIGTSHDPRRMRVSKFDITTFRAWKEFWNSDADSRQTTTKVLNLRLNTSIDHPSKIDLSTLTETPATYGPR